MGTKGSETYIRIHWMDIGISKAEETEKGGIRREWKGGGRRRRRANEQGRGKQGGREKGQKQSEEGNLAEQGSKGWHEWERGHIRSSRSQKVAG